MRYKFSEKKPPLNEVVYLQIMEDLMVKAKLIELEPGMEVWDLIEMVGGEDGDFATTLDTDEWEFIE